MFRHTLCNRIYPDVCYSVSRKKNSVKTITTANGAIQKVGGNRRKNRGKSKFKVHFSLNWRIYERIVRISFYRQIAFPCIGVGHELNNQWHVNNSGYVIL